MVMRSGALCALSAQLLLISAQAAGSSLFFPNSSSSSSSITAAPKCTGCTVTATERYLSYAKSVSTVNQTVLVTVVPYVTQNSDGTNSTQMVTLTRDSANNTAKYTGPPVYAPVTWEHNGVVLTYPTTYVEFFGLSGGLIKPTTVASAGSAVTQCAVESNALTLDSKSASGLIVPVTVKNTNEPISAPAAIHSYLNGIPAVQSQFHNEPVESCSWTKPLEKTAASFESPSPTDFTQPVMKVSVAQLTTITADPVFAPTPNPAVVSIQNVAPSDGGLGGLIASILAQPPDAPEQSGPGAFGIGGNMPIPTGMPQQQQQTSRVGPMAFALPNSASLLPGQETVINGIPFSAGPSGTAIVVGGKTVAAPDIPAAFVSALSAASGSLKPSTPVPASSGAGSITSKPTPTFMINGGLTLTPGQTTVLNGVTYAIPSGGSAVVVASGGIVATATGGLGGYVASGLGYTGPQATGAAVKNLGRSGEGLLGILAAMAVGGMYI